jgi:hypothetical protein
MIEKHPSALDEMKDVMTNIGRKWEANKYSTVKGTYNHPDQLSDSSLSEPIYTNQNRPPPIPPHHRRV